MPAHHLHSTKLATLSLHADDKVNAIPPSLSQEITDVAPALHVSTTFRFSKDPEKLEEAKDVDVSAVHSSNRYRGLMMSHDRVDGMGSEYDQLFAAENHVYSRETAPNTTRLEAILSSVCGGKSLVYGSGLAALFAAYTYFKPKRVSIGGGYHGSHGVLDIHTRLTGLTQLPLDCPADALGPGDIIHIETPFNPTGEAYNIQYYANKAHSRGALLLIDSTFGPPGLQDPFKHGADIIMHSGTKYFGGHSDLLAGVLVVREENEEWWRGLWHDRANMGNVMGNLESWLTVRSMRTLELRVGRASENAGKIIKWLDSTRDGRGQEAEPIPGRELITDLFHASLQAKDPSIALWLNVQMPHGFGPVFAVHFKTPELAKRFPSLLQLFQHATSLGGVESLVEWRAMSDESVDRRLVRFSVGVEDGGDLLDDIKQALGRLKEFDDA